MRSFLRCLRYIWIITSHFPKNTGGQDETQNFQVEKPQKNLLSSLFACATSWLATKSKCYS